jgi:hypothetical protein
VSHPEVILMSDVRVTSIGVDPSDDPLVDASTTVPFDGREDDGTGVARLLRREVAARLADAAARYGPVDPPDLTEG